MKKLLFCILFSSASLATADSSICLVNTALPWMALDSTVTLEGIIVANPMFSELDNLDNLSEEQKSVVLMLKPAKPILLEQWSGNDDSLSCSSEYVTLVLNSKQLAELQYAGTASALGLSTVVNLTGTIRWSESSLEVAGNAVLMNITKLSVQK
jgi:hypothetical protein